MSQNILPEIDLTRCTGCGDCAKACPQNALEIASGFPVFANPAACTFCAGCEEICRARAIQCAFEIAWETAAEDHTTEK